MVSDAIGFIGLGGMGTPRGLLSWSILDGRLQPLQLAGGLPAVSGVVVCQGPEGRGLVREAARVLLARALPGRRRRAGGAQGPPTGGGT